MDWIITDPQQEARTLMLSMQEWMQVNIRTFVKAYEPWLSDYYPLFYLTRVVHRVPQWWLDRDQPEALTDGPLTPPHGFDTSIIAKGALFIAILGPLYYAFLFHCHVVGHKTGRPRRPLDDSDKTEVERLYNVWNRAPSSLLQTDIDFGLTKEEVLQRREKHGVNEIDVTRDWYETLLQMALQTVNLRLEVSSGRTDLPIQDR